MIHKLTIKYLMAAGLYLLLGLTLLQAQKKKDLIAEVDRLQSELATTKTELAQAKKNEAAGNARVAAIESELAELRQTNTTLLANLNKITEESSKKTASISESLTNMQRTERQLRAISDALTRMDSTTLGIVTALKQTMGEDAKMGISNNVVVLSVPNATLFGDNDASYDLSSTDESFFTKIGDILNRYPETKLLIESYANTTSLGKGAPADNLELSALRAVAIRKMLSDSNGIKEDRITATGKGIEGLSVETNTRFHIRPNYEAFHKSLKESIKN